MTPFQADCARKGGGQAQYRDQRLRRQTCGHCGVLKPYHVKGDHCPGFKRMDNREWAAWCGVPVSPKQEDPYRSQVVSAEPSGMLADTFNLQLECGHRDTFHWHFNNGAGYEKLPNGSMDTAKKRLPVSRHCHRCKHEDK